ncbi:MAG: hypothetical protein RR272_05300, partial [Synergistaceae bacterium]
MKKNSTYRIGLDVGISSVGWSVLSGEKNDAILENLGVHLFESGESNNGRDRLSQERRLFRGERRIIRRRYYRKERLKAHLENIGFVTKEEIDSFYLEKSTNIYELKMKAIKEEISPKELLACLLHVCNHRGYRSFYETEDLTESNIEDYETEELETQEDKTEEENKKNEQYVKNFAHLYSESKCETISEFICTKCIDKETRQPYFKNVDSRQEHWLIAREFVEEEVNKILFAQMKYHKKLTLDVVEMCKKIIFSQRDFEEGPGNINEKFRQYSGFLDSVGYCPFYKEELRGFRATPLGDIYAVINKLSQNNYRNIITGSYELPKKAAEEIIKVVINEAKINKTMIKNVFKKYNVEMLENGDIDDKKYSDLLKFIPKVKKTIELNGGNWED